MSAVSAAAKRCDPFSLREKVDAREGGRMRALPFACEAAAKSPRLAAEALIRRASPATFSPREKGVRRLLRSFTLGIAYAALASLPFSRAKA